MNLISANRALEIVLECAAPLGVERVTIREALGRVLAEDIRSPRDIPGFDNSAMDGYAVRSADVAGASQASPVRLRVVDTIGAGRVPSVKVLPGTASRIMTGAPVPEGADAIVQLERTRQSGDVVELMADVAPRNFIRPRGEDLRRDDLAFGAGTELGATDLGMLASLNRSTVEVWRRPRVGIVATGDELVEVDQVPSGAQVVNSSGYALAAAAIEAGAEPVMMPIARDRPELIRQRLAQAFAFDVVLSTGGVSVGQFDYVSAELQRLGMREMFHGVAQKPGKPLAFGTVGAKLLFGLPGNPVSTMVCFYLYALPALHKLSGRSRLGLTKVRVRCGADIRTSANLTEFVRVKVAREGDELVANATGSQSSGVLSSLSRANALLIGPAPATMMKCGDYATVLLLDPAVVTMTEVGFD
jgi:molybdopterin molybdotransferase